MSEEAKNKEEQEYPVITRPEYRRNKEKLREYERKNCNRISAIPCSGKDGWYEIAENSALIYSYVVCEKLGLMKPIHGDEDSFYLQYELGRIRMRGVSEIERNLEQAGMKYQKVEKNYCVVYVLKQGFTQTEMAELRDRELRRQHELNSIVKVTTMEPELHQVISHLSVRIHQICPKMEKHAAAANGKRMMELIDGILVDYYEICKTHRRATVEDWRDMRRRLDRLLCELQLICEVKLYSREKLNDVGNMLEKAQRLLTNIINKEKKEIRQNGAQNQKV